MKIQSITNGGITIVLEPENGLEEELLKALVKQDSQVLEVRTPVNVLSKQIRGSVLICKKTDVQEADSVGNTVCSIQGCYNKVEKYLNFCKIHLNQS